MHKTLTAVVVAAGLALAGCGGSAHHTAAAHPVPHISSSAAPSSNPASASPASTSTANAAVCPWADLSVSINSGYWVTISYSGPVVCSLSGYPIVHFVSSSGQQVGMTALDETKYPPPATPIYLYPRNDGGYEGQHETGFQVIAEDAAHFPAYQCKPVTVSGISVYIYGTSPAGVAAAKTLPVTAKLTCSGVVPEQSTDSPFPDVPLSVFPIGVSVT